jgi:cell division protein FtsW
MLQNKLDRNRKAEKKWIRDVRRRDLTPPTFHSPMLDSMPLRSQLQPKKPGKRPPARKEDGRAIRREKVSYAAEERLAEPSVMQKNFPRMKNDVFLDANPDLLAAQLEKPSSPNIILRRPSERTILPRRTANLKHEPKRPSVPLQVISDEEQKKLESLEMVLPRVAGKPDPLLLVVVLILLCIGLVMVYSASSITAARYYGDASYFFQKQLLGATLGVVVMLVMMRIDYRLWRRFSLLGLAIGLPLLALVLVVGTSAYGASRWLVLGSFISFQPSELIKLVLALYIADWLARKGNQVGTFWYGLAPFVLLVGLVIGLVLLQKDMGTASVIAILTTAMFFTAGANILQFLPALGCGFLIFLSQAFSGYRYYRLIGFLDPFKYTTDINLQLYQSLLALGSGGWLGVGLGASRQKTGYLPLPYIDSIFAIIGEELGYIGCMVVVVLFMILAFRGFRLARRTQDVYGALLATGITTWIIVQAMINIGATTGTIPYTGVPLPFISYGGTSLVITLAGIGVLLNISRYIQKPENPALSRQTITKRLKRKVAE